MSTFFAGVQVVNNQNTIFQNAVDGDLVFYTENSNQSLHFGNVIGDRSTLKLTPSNIEVRGNMFLTSQLEIPAVQIMSTGQLLCNSNDSAAAPAFSFINDSNTGMMHPGNKVLGFVAAGVETMRMNSNGFVSIGTSNAIGRLTVVGGFSADSNNIVIRESVANGRAGIQMQHTSAPIPVGSVGYFQINQATTGNAILENFSADISIIARSNISLVTKTNNVTNVTRMHIANNGFIGIGNTNPVCPLDVTGSGTFTTTATINYFNSSGIQTTLSTVGAGGGTGNTTIRANDHIWAAGFATYSDKRLKNHIVKHIPEWERFNAMNIVNYQNIDYIANPYKHIGLVAQDLETLFPEYVQTGTGVIPNIMKLATISTDGQVMLKLGGNDDDDDDVLKKGDVIRIIKNPSCFPEDATILDVLIDNEGQHLSLTLSVDVSGLSEIYIYGKHVDNFKVVDYQSVSVMAISYIQDLKNQLDKLVKRVYALPC